MRSSNINDCGKEKRKEEKNRFLTRQTRTTLIIVQKGGTVQKWERKRGVFSIKRDEKKLPMKGLERDQSRNQRNEV